MSSVLCILKKFDVGVIEMVQWSRVLVPLTEDSGLGSGAHMMANNCL